MVPHPSGLDCPAVPLAVLLDDPDAHTDRRLGLRQVLARRGALIGTRFTLGDGPHSLTGFQAAAVHLDPGTVVTFTGRLEFNGRDGRYELVSPEPTLRPS